MAFDGVGEGGQMDFPVFEGWARDVVCRLMGFTVGTGQPVQCTPYLAKPPPSSRLVQG